MAYEAQCQEKVDSRGFYCWGKLKHCYTRVGKRWTKVGVYCIVCGHFTPEALFVAERAHHAPAVAS